MAANLIFCLFFSLAFIHLSFCHRHFSSPYHVSTPEQQRIEFNNNIKNEKLFFFFFFFFYIRIMEKFSSSLLPFSFHVWCAVYIYVMIKVVIGMWWEFIFQEMVDILVRSIKHHTTTRQQCSNNKNPLMSNEFDRSARENLEMEERNK